MPACETCRFAVQNVLSLSCRRYPPQITARVGQAPQIWPQVSKSDWCGEHKEKSDD